MAHQRLVFVVGEASGDMLAAEIIDGLVAAGHEVECSGIGGVQMRARGLIPVEAMESLTIMGLTDALKAAARLNGLANRLMRHVAEIRPDAVITIDSKGFNLRFARRLRRRMKDAPPVIHVVAPSVWAWGAWRATAVAKSVDRLLCLYPFEVPYFAAHGLDTHAVGHPAVERGRLDYDTARRHLGLNPGERLLVLLPGSRKREVARLLPDMLAAVRILEGRIAGLKVMVPMAAPVAELITGLVAAEEGIITIPHHDLDLVLAGGDFGLICSGTVTLEAALSGLPGHVYYRTDMLSDFIGRRLVQMNKVVLPNVITGKEIYRFSLGRDFNAASMAAVAEVGLAEGGGRNDSMAAHTARLAETLTSEEGFGAAAAKAIADKIAEHKSIWP